MRVPSCPACAAANPDGNRFCGQCGSPLTVASCGACGATNALGQSFCGQCGASLDLAATPVGAPAVEERKLATILFADVVGFTSFAERTDPEVVARIVDAAFRRLADVVVAHGGTVDKYMGDSMMAVFGVPVSHDDDAERAVAAGLAVRSLGGDLAFSIGINSGEVMATPLGEGGAVTVIGDTVNVAARLEKVAAPGEVLCGRLTAELAGRNVRFRERQPALLKGKQEPVAVWEAVSLRAGDGGPGAEGPALVGRDEELTFLAAQWRRVRRDGQPQIVVVCGESGSGKTRLLDELCLLADGDGTVVRSTYPAYGTLGGVRVAADIVRQLGPAADEAVNTRLRSIAGDLDPSLRAIDPSGMPKEQLWAFTRLIQEKGAARPLLLIIDDMHRGGERALELLGELTTRLVDVPLLLVLSGRTEPGEWLGRFPAATTVRVEPLSHADAVVLAQSFVCDKPLDPEAARFLVDRARGNPLYLRELVAMSRARGSLVDDGDRYSLTAHGAIPATLQALLAARLDALEPAQKLGLQHVAVIGEPASVEQVVALGSIQAEAVLRSLVDLGLLRVGPDGRFEAVDPLLREVAYETLPHTVRGELHRQAAGAMSSAEQRARHLDHASTYLAGDSAVAAEAVAALVTAGTELMESSRHLDALRLLERALVLGSLPSSALLELARLQAMAARDEDALVTLGLIPDDPSDPFVAAERDHTAATTCIFSDPTTALVGLRTATARWHELGNGAKEAWARANAGVALFNLSRMEESAAELEQALALFRTAGDRAGEIAVSSFLCLVKPDDPRVSGWLAEALEFADAVGDRSKQLNTLTTLAWNHFLRSFCGTAADMADAERFAHRLALLAEELGVGELAVQGWSLLVMMMRMSGRLEEAAVHAVALQRATTAVRRRDPWLGWAAGFSVTVALGATGAAAPHPPLMAPDPVVRMATLVVQCELTMAGRVAEALERMEAAPDLGPIADLVQVVRALALVVAGRPDEARPLVERAAAAAQVLDVPTTTAAAVALCAEMTGDLTALPPPPAVARGVTDVLVLRAYAAHGDPAARDALARATQTLRMPGLMIDEPSVG